ncbi:MAG: hypothetical protein RBR26_13505, partial [Methanosarcina mazei]|nr:hypothetical protein [Methanosarcina mazei]
MVKLGQEGAKCGYRDEKASLKGELERQLIHLFTGIFFIIFVYLTGDHALTLLLLLLVFYLAVIYVILNEMLPSPLYAFLCRWGRPGKQNIPLKG